MRIHVNGKNIEITDAIKAYAKEKIGKVAAHYDQIEAIDIMPGNVSGMGAKEDNYLILTEREESVLQGLEDMKTVCHYDLWVGADYNISKVLQELQTKTYFVGLGSIIRACMCIASGDFSLAIFPGTKHKNCDIAAVKVIVEESGGIVTDLFGKEQRYDESINGAIISNGKVHNEVIGIIKKYLIDKSND